MYRKRQEQRRAEATVAAREYEEAFDDFEEGPFDWERELSEEQQWWIEERAEFIRYMWRDDE